MARMAISDEIYTKMIAVSVETQKNYQNFRVISVRCFMFPVYDTVDSVYLRRFTCLNNATFVIVKSFIVRSLIMINSVFTGLF